MRESRERSSRRGERVCARVARLLFQEEARGFERRPRNGPGQVGKRRDVSVCKSRQNRVYFIRRIQ